MLMSERQGVIGKWVGGKGHSSVRGNGAGRRGGQAV